VHSALLSENSEAAVALKAAHFSAMPPGACDLSLSTGFTADDLEVRPLGMSAAFSLGAPLGFA